MNVPSAATHDMMTWRADWLWALPLIVATVIIHVSGLAVLREQVFDAVGRFLARRHVKIMFAAVMGITVVLVAILLAIDAWVWAAAYWLLGALPDLASSVLFSLSAMTTYGGSGLDLQQHWQLMGALEALNGIILFGLTTAFLFSMIQEVWLAEREHRHRH
jgi:hypothetical protein